MLTKWHQANANLKYEVLVEQLIGALMETDLVQIADKVRSVADHSTDQNIEGVFAEISNGLISRWRDVGAILGLSQDDCDMISVPQPLQDYSRFQMLQIWNQSSQDNTRPTLLRALRELERLDIVRLLDAVPNQQLQLLPKEHSEEQTTSSVDFDPFSLKGTQHPPLESPVTAPDMPPDPPTEYSEDHEGSAQRRKKLEWFQSTQLPQVKQTTGWFAEWFHGIIHRRKAELLLENKPKGSFLIRVSESRLGYSLSFNAEDRCRHYVIDQTLSKKYVITGESHGHQSLSDLVLYYQQNTLPNSTMLLGESCGQQNGQCDFENLLTPLDQTDSND